jgi:hypothetical protein
MELLELLGAGASVAGGGVFGLLGSIGSSLLKGRAQAEERAHELAVKDKELTAAQSGHLQKIVEARQAMSSAGLVESIKSDTTPNLPQWAAAAKAMYRPFLTTLLVCVSAYIFSMLLDALSGDNVLAEAFPRDDILAMIRYTVYSLIFSTATAITWWFGDRALAPPAMK